jgi:hypothetical protein
LSFFVGRQGRWRRKKNTKKRGGGAVFSVQRSGQKCPYLRYPFVLSNEFFEYSLQRVEAARSFLYAVEGVVDTSI